MSMESYRRFIVKNPWYENWKCARRRCSDPTHKDWSRYGGRGIKFLLTKQDVEALWNQFRAAFMVSPHLNRINVDGHYEVSNCNFVPAAENLRLRDLRDPDWK